MQQNQLQDPPTKWLLGIAVVVFDIDVGQRIDHLVPANCLTEDEGSAVAFHSFPVGAHNLQRAMSVHHRSSIVLTLVHAVWCSQPQGMQGVAFHSASMHHAFSYFGSLIRMAPCIWLLTVCACCMCVCVCVCVCVCGAWCVCCVKCHSNATTVLHLRHTHIIRLAAHTELTVHAVAACLCSTFILLYTHRTHSPWSCMRRAASETRASSCAQTALTSSPSTGAWLILHNRAPTAHGPNSAAQ